MYLERELLRLLGCTETDVPEPTLGAVARRTIPNTYEDFAFA